MGSTRVSLGKSINYRLRIPWFSLVRPLTLLVNIQTLLSEHLQISASFIAYLLLTAQDSNQLSECKMAKELSKLLKVTNSASIHRQSTTVILRTFSLWNIVETSLKHNVCLVGILSLGLRGAEKRIPEHPQSQKFCKVAHNTCSLRENRNRRRIYVFWSLICWILGDSKFLWLTDLSRLVCIACSKRGVDFTSSRRRPVWSFERVSGAGALSKTRGPTESIH